MTVDFIERERLVTLSYPNREIQIQRWIVRRLQYNSTAVIHLTLTDVSGREGAAAALST